MTTKMLKDQLGDTMEAYIDDMVVISKSHDQHVTDLQVVFNITRKHKLRLNASKCSFGVSSNKFLGYLVTRRGIESDPFTGVSNPMPEGS